MNPTTANLEKIDTWIRTLADETDAAAHSAEMTSFLNTLSRFWAYSARNCYLITTQRPTATRVASRKTWESLGRTLLPDEWRNSIQVVCPHFKTVRDEATGQDKQVLVRFSTGYVYDVSQTEGKPLTSLTWQQTPGCYELYRSLTDAARRFGLTIVEQGGLPPNLHGWSEGNGRIVLNSDDMQGTRCETLLHELGHELCHDSVARKTFSKAMLETQADSIAYCCCQALNIPSPNTPNYLAFMRVDREMVMANLDAIRSGVVRVLRAVERAEDTVMAA